MDIKNESRVNLTVEDLKEAIKDLPDDMPIIIPVITRFRLKTCEPYIIR